VIDQIHQTFAKQAGAWDDYVANHLLNRVFGFELLMAPYAVAHLKLGMQLQATGYRFASDQRLGIYLTNTLEEAAKKSEQLIGSWVADEANAAADIKNKMPIVVVTGNPPYSSSMCESAWIMSLIMEYKKNLAEKKADLNREEWKFLRFAQWRIDKTGEGIVAFIINNTFLDAITHRKMRASLLRGFQEIYVLDLHGSVKRRDASQTGSVDENVFDIEQGVAIAIFVKCKDNGKLSTVRHAEITGLRETKYDILSSTDLSTTDWHVITADGDECFFVPRTETFKKEYSEGVKLTDVFPTHSSGIQTKKDRIAIHLQRSSVLETVREFAGMGPDEARQRFALGKDSSGWSIKAAQDDLRRGSIEEKRVIPILYRPFDIRFTYYTERTGGFLGRPRRAIMQHMLRGPNIGMIGMRQIVGGAYSYFGVTNIVNCHGTFYLGNKGQDYLFPLFLYPAEGLLPAERIPNFGRSFLVALADALRVPLDGPHGLPHGITPEDIFHYAYAVFHSPTYRSRYAEFLKIDFPRLPLTSDVGLFRALGTLGAELVTLHLLESPKLNDLLTEWPVKGDNTVENVEYAENGGRVSINKTQYFGGVPKAIWDFRFGGYRVCEQWLEHRRGRKLTYDDTQHYQRVVVALNETIRLMGEIDQVIGQHGGWPIR
jgi:predicted helicase